MKKSVDNQLSINLVNIYTRIEEQILINISKKLNYNGLRGIDDVRSWQFDNLSKLGTLTNENIKVIQKYSKLSKDEIKTILVAYGYDSVEEQESFFEHALESGKDLLKPHSIQDSEALTSILNAYEQQANEIFNLVNTTLISQSQQAMLDIVNETTSKVLAGVSTPKEALTEVASKWAQTGLPALIDKSGRKWSTEAYVNMITRTMGNKVANDMQFARADEYGVDLVEISSHADARPKCAPYQGKIFSRNGKSKKYPPLSSTSYGRPDGISGVNCRHILYPYIQGISKQTYKPYNKKENEKAYEDSQKQRRLEREIRNAKRELNFMENMGSEEGSKVAKEKVLAKQRKMRELLEETGRKRRYEREKPY